MTRILFSFIAMLLCHQHLYAQQASKDAVMQQIRKVSDHYKSIPSLSFDMHYYYSAETAPSSYLDSLKGSLKVQGNDCWYSIDSTESISSGGYTILLFKEDKIMYLTQADSASRYGNPVALMDSILLNNKEITCQLNESKTETVVSLELPPGGNSKRVEYHINKKTGFIDMVRNVVKSNQLYDASVRDRVSGNDSYVCVDVFYKQYRKAAFDPVLFDRSRYFKREGQEYVAIAPYTEYKIFLGTPQL